MHKFIFLSLLISMSCKEPEQKMTAQVKKKLTETKVTPMKKTITINAKDGLSFSADLYLTDTKDAPFILLFHQAGYSRGEYLETAPKLNALGFNCIAIDQRSGKEINGVENTATAQAIEQNKPIAFIDALPDLEAAVEYTKSEYAPKKLILLGSSYSSSMVFILANTYKNNIDAILAFSPGEYFLHNNKTIAEYASTLDIPVFITSSKSEADKLQPIFKAVPSEKKVNFIPKADGVHGAKALWDKNPNHKEYWEALEQFLKSI